MRCAPASRPPCKQAATSCLTGPCACRPTQPVAPNPPLRSFVVSLRSNSARACTDLLLLRPSRSRTLAHTALSQSLEEAVEQRKSARHHQRHRAPARGVQAAYQDAERAALGRDSPPCCSGRCSRRIRSACARSTAGARSITSLLRRLSPPPEQLLSRPPEVAPHNFPTTIETAPRTSRQVQSSPMGPLAPPVRSTNLPTITGGAGPILRCNRSGQQWVNLPRSSTLMVTPEEPQRADDFTKPLPACPKHVGCPPALLRQLLRERPG